MRTPFSVSGNLAAAVAIFFALASLGCTPNQKILESANATPEPVDAVAVNNEKPANQVEQDLQAMRNADFNFIFLFRRKDGAAMEADDKKFFNTYSPPETNRRRLSDEGRAIIIGSNYRWPAETFKLFTDRFNLEDYSKPENEIINANAADGNKNTNAKPKR